MVIYCYEDGSRGREALKHILGDSQVKALQSDGYNVYMYLDDHMVDIEHLCCMAHARSKFKYALEQGGDKDAAFILELIGELYKLEREYEEGKLSPEQIRFCRNNLKTKEIIINTIISTCKMQGVSVLDYFKRFFSEIVKGRRDYEHLLPLTIGLN